MFGLSVSAWVPIVVLTAFLAADLWVYADAKAHSERGNPVVRSFGSFEVNTPAAWFLGCLLLWILFFPLYMKSRDRAG
jgi:putative flippase GtrA